MEAANEVGGVMNIAHYHASKFGNGAMVAEGFDSSYVPWK
jgi:hypothetical protein